MLALGSRPNANLLEYHHPRRPPLPDPPHILRKLPTRDLAPAPPVQRRMLVRVVERVLQQPYVRPLHRPEHRLQLGVPQPALLRPRRVTEGGGVDAAAAHVDDADEADARVGLEAVGGEAVIDGLEEAELAREAHARGGVCAGAQVEDVDGGGEQEGELEGAADGGEGVCGRVVGWEDGDVEGAVLLACQYGKFDGGREETGLRCG